MKVLIRQGRLVDPVGGIGGGIIGRKLNRRMGNQAVERLFIGLMAVIICISLFNTWRYAGW